MYKNAVDLAEGANQAIDFISGGGHIVQHNIFFAPGRTAISDGNGNVYTAMNNLEVDPRFVDADRFDFHIQAGSPAIDAGTSQEAIRADLEGSKRPQAGGYDIGAYEFK